MGKKLTDSFGKLEKLYSTLPAVPCISCGLCCVSPHMTLLEFAYFISGMLNEGGDDKLIELVKTPPKPETRYEGNFVCKAQEEKGKCNFHKYRSAICRLEGLPVLNEMGIRDYIICPYISEEDMEEKVSPEVVDKAVEEVFALTNEFIPVYEEPYWLSGLNIDCWFSVAFDTKITQPDILKVRAIIRNSLDLDFLEMHYVDYTHLSEKFRLIDRFFFEAGENKNPKEAINILKEIRDKFPYTGTYYYDEAEQYLTLMKKIIREQRKIN